MGEYYEEGIGKCTVCNTACRSCIGPLETDCSACFEGKIYREGECLTCEEADHKLITIYGDDGIVYCSEKCGDGYNLGIKACDDANLLNEDGCDENCNLEEGYICGGGSLISPDICRSTIRPTFHLSFMNIQNDFLIIQFDKPVYKTAASIEFRDVIEASVEGPLPNYTFEYNVANYLITKQISESGLTHIKNSDIVTNYEDPKYQFDPFFNQLRVDLTFKCTISGSKVVYIYIYVYYLFSI